MSTLTTVPLEQLADAVASRLSQLRRALLHEVGGPSPTQQAVLARLADEGPHRITALAAAERVAQPTMTTLVGRLERQGWVSRRPDARDGRAVVAEITAAGRAELERVRLARRRALAARIAELTPAERHDLAAALPALDKLIAAD